MNSATRLLLAAALLPACIRAYTPLATSAEVKEFLGDRKGVAIFGDNQKRNMVIKLSLPEMKAETLATFGAGSNVFDIRISPDGKYALCNVDDQFNLIDIETKANKGKVAGGKGQAFWRHPQTQELFVVYGMGVPSMTLANEAARYPGVTLMRKLENDKLSDQIDTLLKEGFRGGLSKDGRWLGTAYNTAVLYDRVLAKRKMLTQLPTTRTYTCWPYMSPSVAPERMDQLMFINELHDTLLVKNSQDQTVWSLGWPAAQFGTFVVKDNTNNSNKWHSGGWSNDEEIFFTGMTRTAGKDMNGQTFTGNMFVLVRKSDKKVQSICRGGPYQDFHVYDAPAYQGQAAVSLLRFPERQRGKGGLRAGLLGMPEGWVTGRVPAGYRSFTDLSGRRQMVAPIGGLGWGVKSEDSRASSAVK